MTEAGPWRLGPVLAAGALGEVREAASAAGVRAVVKVLHSHTARDPQIRALFARECALTGGLPADVHLVRGLGSDAEAERPWLALERVDGPDLRAAIDGGARPNAAAVVAAVARGAATLHAHGWVHGDIVPQNVLLGREGTVLCDLGVARPIGEPGPVRGTAAYMAPEQVRGEPWSPAVDVFALGIILWELSAGARLFHRGHAFLSMAAVVEEDAPLLADTVLAPIAAAALAKSSDVRPSAARLAETLDTLR
jgi:serine/threonine protein kinase